MPCVSQRALVIACVLFAVSGISQAQNLLTSVAPAASTDHAAPAAGTDAAVPTATAGDPLNVKPHKPVPMTLHLRNGILTIDGAIAKVRLDYDVKKQTFAYVYLPGVGVAVVSRFPVSGAMRVHGGFSKDHLQFAVGTHDIDLRYTDEFINRHGEDAYVRLDDSAKAMHLGRYPMIGFGTINEAPYEWPLALPGKKAEANASGVTPPPLPASILPNRGPRAVSDIYTQVATK